MKKVLRRLLSSILFIFCFFLLIGCINRKIHYFIEGNFIAVYEGKEYYLDVNLINEEEYKKSLGINVIKDIVHSDKHFEISLYIFDSEQNKTLYTFHNLTEHLPNTSAIPLSYIDDYNNEIQPHYDEKHSDTLKRLYSVAYNSKYLDFERR